MSMAYLFCRFVCGVTPYLPNSHRTSIGIQSFRPKPFSSSSTSGYSFRHTLNARTPRPASSRTRARANPATRCGARVGTPGHPGGRRFTPRRSSRPWRCSWLHAWEVPRRIWRPRPRRRSEDSRRHSRRPRARARSSSARGRRFRPWEIARTRSRRPRRRTRPGCRHRRRPRRRTPPSFSRGRRGTGSSRSTAPTDPSRAPSPSGARRCGG